MYPKAEAFLRAIKIARVVEDMRHGVEWFERTGRNNYFSKTDWDGGDEERYQKELAARKANLEERESKLEELVSEFNG